jgi:hypothetical protein
MNKASSVDHYTQRGSDGAYQKDKKGESTAVERRREREQGKTLCSQRTHTSNIQYVRRRRSLAQHFALIT